MLYRLSNNHGERGGEGEREREGERESHYIESCLLLLCQLRCVVGQVVLLCPAIPQLEHLCTCSFFWRT